MARVEEVVRVTNNNELAISAARCASAALFKLLHGMPLPQAFNEALPFAGNTLEPLLAEALAMPQLDSIAAAERFGSSCHVAEGLPVIFHLAQHAPDYKYRGGVQHPGGRRQLWPFNHAWRDSCRACSNAKPLRIPDPPAVAGALPKVCSCGRCMCRALSRFYLKACGTNGNTNKPKSGTILWRRLPLNMSMPYLFLM